MLNFLSRRDQRRITKRPFFEVFDLFLAFFNEAFHSNAFGVRLPTFVSVSGTAIAENATDYRRTGGEPR
ncbi:protein of unknown function (plasmid) [Caballeronia sp. S22]